MFSRRQTLKTVSAGFGYLAFADILHKAAAAELSQSKPLSPKAPHFPAKAKRIIFLCMQGGPSHVDSFDLQAATSGRSWESGSVWWFVIAITVAVPPTR